MRHVQVNFASHYNNTIMKAINGYDVRIFTDSIEAYNNEGLDFQHV